MQQNLQNTTSDISLSQIDFQTSCEIYPKICDVIQLIHENWQEQPSLEDLAHQVDMSPFTLQKQFSEWAGLSPKSYLQALTLHYAKGLLSEGLPLLDTAYELGLSGPSRLHDLFVTHEAMSPGDYKKRGDGLVISYGYHPSPFGLALIMATEQGIAGMAFADIGGEREALEDMMRRWPKAQYVENKSMTAPYVARIFDPKEWREDRPLRVVLIGSDFEIKVWQGLLKIPFGEATTYSGLAGDLGNPKAARAVGSAVGRNPISFIVPCHRVLGKGGAITGYHWGVTRKRAILGWEACVAEKV